MQALTILCVLFAVSASATNPCPRPCKCYTTDNGILAANCTTLPEDDGQTLWPQKILRVHFGDRHGSPAMLKNMAFQRFPQLTYLDIAGGPVQYVGSLAFDGLTELVELNLVGTGIRKLHRNTFAGNRKLAFLSLKKNPRLFVAPSFLTSESITELDLSECSLTALKSVYFEALPNLKYLFASNNELRTLGRQFGPAGLKYVNLAHNRIETVTENLDAYKRLRTVDLTGNPVNCTCELSETDRKLTARGVAFGDTITCQNTGKPLGDMVETCSDKEMMMGDDPTGDMYKADNLLKIDKSVLESMDKDDLGSGSGSGDGEGLVVLSTDVKSTEPTVVVESTFVTPTVADDQVKNETLVIDGKTSNETEEVVEVFTKTHVADTMAEHGGSSEPPVTEVETASSESEVSSEMPSGKEPPQETETTNTEVPVTAETAVPPSVPSTTTSSSGGNLTGAEPNIISETIKAPEENEDVQTRVAEYVKSNAGITVTAAILAVVIVAIVYKAVCMGKSRRDRAAAAMADDKIVELKEIKYTAADTEDRRGDDDDDDDGDDRQTSPAEEKLLKGDQTDDEDDESTTPPSSSSPSPPPANGHHTPSNGLLHSVMDAMKDNGPDETTNVPTRVVVKLVETPKAAKPITINNVH